MAIGDCLPFPKVLTTLREVFEGRGVGREKMLHGGQVLQAGSTNVLGKFCPEFIPLKGLEGLTIRQVSAVEVEGTKERAKAAPRVLLEKLIIAWKASPHPTSMFYLSRWRRRTCDTRHRVFCSRSVRPDQTRDSRCLWNGYTAIIAAKSRIESPGSIHLD